MMKAILLIGIIAAVAHTESLSGAIDRGHVDEKTVTFESDANTLIYSVDMSLTNVGYVLF